MIKRKIESAELEDLANKYADFKTAGCEIYSVSTDTHFVHKAWHDASDRIKKIQYPMLADPTHALVKDFDVLIEADGLAERGSFIVNPEGRIVSIKDKYGNEETYDCDGKHEFQKPLAVLANGYSASASEIFAGAVKDYGIGTLVGTTTYGKGIVQELFSFEDDTMIKITTAEYFTPSGENIHKKGIQPDVEVEYTYDAANPTSDNQLQKALDVVKSK